jgi:hypothetical protein
VLEPVYDVASDKRTFAVCKTADVATTVGILKAGGMEVNPVMHALMGSAPYSFLPFVAISAALVGLVWWIDQPEVTAGASLITCPIAAHNLIQLAK